jgi:hypothetical protein
MQAVDISVFLNLIDDMLLYNPIPDKLTLEALVPTRANLKSLRISKRLTSGYLEIEVLPSSMKIKYFFSASEDPAGEFTIFPPNEDCESIRDKLRSIIVLDAQSRNKQVSTSLDLFRPERPLQ